jgi:hypothetical protein
VAPAVGSTSSVRATRCTAVEGKGSSASTLAPPHEVALFLVQGAMLGGRDFAGRARDQGPRALAGEPTDLDAKALGLRVKLRAVGKTSSGRVEEPKQLGRREVVDVRPSLGGHHAALASPVQVTPISR